MSLEPTYVKGHGLLKGKTVLVTAAAGTGIGFATAKRCVEEGAVVVLSDQHERRLGESAERLAELVGRPPTTVVCDVTQEAQIQRMFEVAIAESGRLDVLVNNAGLGGTANLIDMTDEQWNAVIDVTLNGTMTPATSIHKLFWAGFHRDLGELAVDVLGAGGIAGATGEAERLAGVFLYSRADTIYGGSNQIQRNVIGERALGLPKEPR